MQNNKYHFYYGRFTITIERERNADGRYTDVWNYVTDDDKQMRMIDAGYEFFTHAQAEMAAKKFIDKNFPVTDE